MGELMNNIKQVIVIRADLKMRRGKESAQIAHASQKVFFDRMNKNNPEFSHKYGDFNCDFTHPMLEWMGSNYTKIVVSCNSEEELFNLHTQAKEAGIINAIIQDLGFTEFKEDCPICNRLGLIETSVGSNTFRGTDYTCDKCNGSGKISKLTYTSLAIGPDYSEKIDPITGHLKLR